MISTRATSLMPSQAEMRDTRRESYADSAAAMPARDGSLPAR